VVTDRSLIGNMSHTLELIKSSVIRRFDNSLEWINSSITYSVCVIYPDAATN